MKARSGPTVNSFSRLGEISVEFFGSLNFRFGSLNSVITVSFLLGHHHLTQTLTHQK